MGVLQELAGEIEANERTLRRAAAQGTLRCRRPGPRQLQLDADERAYLRDHWHMIGELRKVLRTDRRVRLAVLYGSIARGDEDAGSDLDLLVSLSDDRPQAATDIAVRLSQVTERPVDVTRLERVEEKAPLLLERVLDEGRVLIDRDGRWVSLRERRNTIRGRARRAYRRQMAAAERAMDELVAG